MNTNGKIENVMLQEILAYFRNLRLLLLIMTCQKMWCRMTSAWTDI